jgi:hypothetical protein
MAMDRSEDDRIVLDLLIRGFQISRTIRLIADLSLADRIAPNAPSKLADLAGACGVLPRPLSRAMRALAAHGIFHIDAEGFVTHTPRSLLLRSDTLNNFHHAARFWTARGSWHAWEFLDVALTGGSPHEIAWGMSRFSYLRQHADEARIFDAFMASFPDDRHNAVAVAYDFSSSSLIADIGGGNGETLRCILARNAKLRGLLFDRPDVVAAIPAEELADGRLAVEGGSFFDKVPAGADTYLLSRVIHDWGDEDAVRILRTCRAAISGRQRLLIIEIVLPDEPADGNPMDYLVDMQMMAMFGTAEERTEAEFRTLLRAGGFDLEQVIRTPSSVSIVEGRPV